MAAGTWGGFEAIAARSVGVRSRSCPGGGVTVGVGEVALGEFERRAAGRWRAGRPQRGRGRGDQRVGVGRDQLDNHPPADGWREDELGGAGLAAPGVDDDKAGGPAVPATGEAREPTVCDV